MHYIKSQKGKYHIEEPCAGKSQARFCRGSHSRNYKFNYNLNKETML